MSITPNGVRIDRRRRGFLGVVAFAIIEIVFSCLLVVSLSANLLFPQTSQATAGVPSLLSYQGRLTDLSGNTLGGALGTNYCFRFSIYDAATSGSKLWPAGTPASTTVKVKDGVFSAQIGSADSLSSFDFSQNTTMYLQVDINANATTCDGSWESLDVRQAINAVGFARAAEGVYSSLLRAPTGGTVVQIGTGAGATTPIFLGLDVKSADETVGASCTTSGQLWYNSADSRLRGCQGSTIMDLVGNLLVKDEGANQGYASTALDFTGAGVSASKGAGGVINVNIPFGGIAVNGGATQAGQIVFSNSNGVSFGLNGSTITASVAAGGGNTLSLYENMPLDINTVTVNGTAFLGATSFIQHFYLPAAESFSYLRFPVSMANQSSTYATSANNTAYSASIVSTLNLVVYSLGNGLSSLSLQSVASGSVGLSQQFSISETGTRYTISMNITYPYLGGTSNLATTMAFSNSSIQLSTGSLSNFTGIRLLDIPLAASLPAGNYWMAFGMSSNTTTQGNAALTQMRLNTISLMMNSQFTSTVAQLGNASASSVNIFEGNGSFSTAGGGTTASIPLSAVSSIASHQRMYFQGIDIE